MDLFDYRLEDEEMGLGLFKARPDGSERELLLDGPCWYINVRDDMLYFIHYESEEPGEHSRIYSMKTAERI